MPGEVKYFAINNFFWQEILSLPRLVGDESFGEN